MIVLNKVALSVQVNMKADLREIYGSAALDGSSEGNVCVPGMKHALNSI